MKDRQYWFAIANGVDGAPYYLVIDTNRQPSEPQLTPRKLASQGKKLGDFLANHCSYHARRQLAKVLASSVQGEKGEYDDRHGDL